MTENTQEFKNLGQQSMDKSEIDNGGNRKPSISDVKECMAQIYKDAYLRKNHRIDLSHDEIESEPIATMEAIVKSNVFTDEEIENLQGEAGVRFAIHQY